LKHQIINNLRAIFKEISKYFDIVSFVEFINLFIDLTKTGFVNLSSLFLPILWKYVRWWIKWLS